MSAHWWTELGPRVVRSAVSAPGLGPLVGRAVSGVALGLGVLRRQVCWCVGLCPHPSCSA